MIKIAFFNNKGGVGINWQVQLMNLKVLGNKGAGNIGGLPKAIRYAVDNGADVINISLVGGEDNGTSDAIQYAYEHGVFVVAAAGNSRISLNNSPQYPVCADAVVRPKEYVIGVSAVTVERMLAEFSNIGSNCIDITSPGVNIYGPLRFSPTNKFVDLYSSSTPWHGTSFAAPFVSGAAALIKSVQPGWTPDQIFDAMAKTISKTTPKNEEEYQQLFGAGLLQIGPAVAYALGQERTMRTTTPVSFGIFQLDTGRVALDALDYATTQKALRRVDDVTGYYNQDVRWVATSQFNTQTKQVRINIYDEQWILFNTIDIPSEQPLGIRIGNVVGTSEKELIMFPLQQSTMLFSVYDMKGNLIQEKKNTKKHSGTSVELVPAASGEYANMLVSFINTQGNTQIDRYDHTYTRIHTVLVSELSSVPSVIAFNIDIDDAQEYIVGAGVGDMPYVVIIDDSGEEIRRFLVSKASYLGGIDILMSPQKQGAPQDIWVSKRSGSRIVTAYSLLGTKGKIFYPFSKAIKPSSRMHLRVIR